MSSGESYYIVHSTCDRHFPCTIPEEVRHPCAFHVIKIIHTNLYGSVAVKCKNNDAKAHTCPLKYCDHYWPCDYLEARKSKKAITGSTLDLYRWAEAPSTLW